MRRSCCCLTLVLLLAALVAGQAAGAPADPAFRKFAADFFDAHCTDCHDGATQKGGVNLEALDVSMSGRDHADLARIDVGESDDFSAGLAKSGGVIAGHSAGADDGDFDAHK